MDSRLMSTMVSSRRRLTSPESIFPLPVMLLPALAVRASASVWVPMSSLVIVPWPRQPGQLVSAEWALPCDSIERLKDAWPMRLFGMTLIDAMSYVPIGRRFERQVFKTKSWSRRVSSWSEKEWKKTLRRRRRRRRKKREKTLNHLKLYRTHQQTYLQTRVCVCVFYDRLLVVVESVSLFAQRAENCSMTNALNETSVGSSLNALFCSKQTGRTNGAYHWMIDTRFLSLFNHETGEKNRQWLVRVRTLSIYTKCRSHTSISLVSVNLSSRSLCAYWLHLEGMISPVVHCHRFCFLLLFLLLLRRCCHRRRRRVEGKTKREIQAKRFIDIILSRTFSCLIIELTSSLF